MTRYAELHCRTAFSFLEGASHPEELIARALELGLSALAITDRNGLHGVVEARERLCEIASLECADEGRAPLRLIYGSEITVGVGHGDGGHAGDDSAVLLVSDLGGYHRLAGAVTRGRLAADKGEFRLSFAELVAETDGGAGLFVLAGGPRSAAMDHLSRGDTAAAARALARWREAFGDRVHVELVRHVGPGDRMGIFEIFEIDDEVRHMINNNASTIALRQRARELGMRTLREDGIRKVLSGMTSAEEVIGASMGDDA